VIAAGPLLQPPAPTVDVAPPATSFAPIGSLVGPFTVTSNQPAATVTASSGSMFSDAAGTVPVPNGASVSSGTQLWLRGTAAGPATIRASVSTLIQSGNVYLYSPANPANPNPVEAQTLILAQQGTATTLDEAQATFFDQGSLIVTKTISGDGAPFHGTITITVVCPTLVNETMIIPAGTATNVSQTFGPFPTPLACSVTETGDGASPPGVTVVVTGSGQTVVIPQNTDPSDSVTATIGDVYTAQPGSLSVRKVFQGAGAGQQGPVIITIDCGAAFQTTVTIPAGQTAPFEQTFTGIPAGAACTVTESGGDVTGPLAASLEPPETVTIPPGGEVEVEFVNTFEPAPTTTTTTTTTTTLPTSTTLPTTTTLPDTTTTSTPVSPTSVAPTTTDPGTLPDTGGGSITGFLLGALTVAGIGFVVLAGSRFPRLEDH
jgi:hypothetical protein